MPRTLSQVFNLSFVDDNGVQTNLVQNHQFSQKFRQLDDDTIIIPANAIDFNVPIFQPRAHFLAVLTANVLHFREVVGDGLRTISAGGLMVNDGEWGALLITNPSTTADIEIRVIQGEKMP